VAAPSRLLLACDVDGTLIDTTASFTRIVLEVTGAGRDEIERFRDRGGFNDDWELARALTALIRAGRPDILHEVFDYRDVIARVGHDPGDLSAQCTALYRGGYWRNERVLVPGALLAQAHARHRVVACTGRDRWELDRAQELLGFVFADVTCMEHVKKPDPHALLRLLRDEAVVVLLGDTEADRLTVQNARAQMDASGQSVDVRFFRAHSGDDPRTSAAAFLRDVLACQTSDGLTRLLADRCSPA
jgi:phosphoglycolate phosphatase-like HAD superfamily hydrolase